MSTDDLVYSPITDKEVNRSIDKDTTNDELEEIARTMGIANSSIITINGDKYRVIYSINGEVLARKIYITS